MHQNEFKHTKLSRFYICNFDDQDIDPSITIQEKPTFLPANKVSFDKVKLLYIAHQCIGDSSISYTDHLSALDTLKNSTATDKAIWGITNYSINKEYCYLVFGCYLSQRAVVADEYLLKLNGDSLEILEINPVIH